MLKNQLFVQRDNVIYSTQKNSGNVGDAHSVVGYGNAGGNYATDAVAELAVGNHTAAALQCKGKILKRREFVKAAHKSEVEFAARLLLQHQGLQ